MRSQRSLVIIGAVLLLGFFVLGLGGRPAGLGTAQGANVVLAGKEVDDAKAELAKLGPPSRAFALISKIIRPSVVSVLTTRKMKAEMPGVTPFDDEWPFGGPNPFKDFEKRYGKTPEQEIHGLGSGVIVDKQGHVLTNNHVVEGSKDIKVVLADESEYAADLVGTDSKTDLAVIVLKNCPAEKIIAASLGDSDKLEVGEWVLAVGAPFGLPQSVSAGIVSATGRSGVDVIHSPYRYESFIQTDAAINRGNSGGPLVNYKAEVIGINTAIATGSGSYEGVGFAIPSKMANRVMGELISKGHVVRGYLGVVIRDVKEDDVAKHKLAKREGIMVENVYPDTPASKAGMKDKDVIMGLAGKPVPSVEQLRTVIADSAPGAKVKLDVVREGKPLTLDVTVEEQPEEMPAAMNSTVDQELGLNLQTLTDDIAGQIEIGGKAGVYKGEHGVLVTDVDPDGAAARAGIKPMDLIKKVGNKPVSTAGEYIAARKGLTLEKGVLLLVKTGEAAKLVLVKTQ